MEGGKVSIWAIRYINRNYSDMKRFPPFLLLILVLTTCSDKKPVFEAPLLENIGDYQVNVTTQAKYAQLFLIKE